MITAVAVIIIFVAVIFSIFRFAIPYVTHYGDTIEVELSRQLDMKVEIDEVDADVSWLTPRLNLLGVRISDPKSGKQVFSADEVNLGLGWQQSFRNMRPELGFVSLVGIDLHARRKANGDLVIQGFTIPHASSDTSGMPPALLTFLENSSVYVVDSALQWHDEKNNDQQLQLINVNLALLNDAPGHKLAIDADLPEDYGQHLNLVFDIEGPLNQLASWKGRIFAGVRGLRLKRWLDDYWQLVSFNGSGRVDASVWLDWEGELINTIDVDVSGEDMNINYLERDVRSWQLQHLGGQFRWQRTDNGWNLDVRNLLMQRNDLAWPQTGDFSFQYHALDAYVEVQSSFVRIQDVAYLGGLVSRFVPIQDFDWNRMVDVYQPQGDLSQLALFVPLAAPQDSSIRGQFRNLGYQSDGVLPAVQGLDGSLNYDGDVTLLQLDSRQVEVDYPALFRNQLDLSAVAGELRLLRGDQQWRFVSDELNVDTPHLDTRSRLDITIPFKGAPFIDMVTRFHKGEGGEKSRYLPAAIMPKATVEWLDKSIVNAQIPDGGFLFYGRVSDYPFSHGEGVMQALFDVRHATLKYQPDWPALEDLSARVEFYNRRLSITRGKGQILGSPFYDTGMLIPDLHNATLSIHGKVKSELPRMQSFIAHSPLHKVFGQYFLNLQMQGQANLDLDITIPIKGEESTRLSGDLALLDDEIYFPEQNYRLQGIKGGIQFTEDSVQASQISARVSDDSELKIDVSTVEEDDDSLIRIEGRGQADAKTLLAPVPMLVDYFNGRSHWNVQVDIPIKSSEAPIQIAVDSSLRGVSSNLPGCFGKTSEQNSLFNFNLALMDQGAMDMEVSFQQMYSVHARREQQKWQVDVRSNDLIGHARFDEDFDADTPVVVYADYVNVGALIGDDEGSDERLDVLPQQIPPLRVQIGKLDWDDYHFSDLNLETRRSPNRMDISHFELHAPTVTIMGQGSWSSDWRKQQSTIIDFSMDTHNLGETLSQFKITEAIEKTEGVAKVHWEWNGRPDQFSWDMLRGQARLDLKNGAFKDIDAGAGRLIGILNFETLLSLDFGNQVAKGFAFDNLEGDVRFDIGNAYTRDLTVDSKVAEIILDGRIGLSARDYDQTITVIPGVGSTLTLIGAVTGGPATAAAVHLFRKLFGLDRIAEYKYSVTGSWEKPKVELLSAPDKEADQDASNIDN